MRSFLLSLVVLAGCASNAAELHRSRVAVYQTDPTTLLQATAAAIEAQHYKVDAIDPDEGELVTHDKVFGPDGMTESVGAGDAIQVADRSIVLAFVVKTVPDRDRWRLTVEPKIRRIFVDRPNLDDLTLDDPTTPGWVRTRLEELTIAIHDALAAYEVKSPPTP